MNRDLLKALIALLPAGLLFVGSTVSLFSRKSRYSFLQFLGSLCLVIVVLTHICEALRLFPAMQWGHEHSVGHYVDLGTAVVGLGLFCAGYFLQALASK
jgi:succinate dehydrogenase/fumarate reductase cytochrome b subunit